VLSQFSLSAVMSLSTALSFDIWSMVELGLDLGVFPTWNLLRLEFEINVFNKFGEFSQILLIFFFFFCPFLSFSSGPYVMFVLVCQCCHSSV
jgi:hypothetical protein